MGMFPDSLPPEGSELLSVEVLPGLQARAGNGCKAECI